jgi:uncharacterized protein
MSEFISVTSAETFVAVLTTLSELIDKAETHCRERRIDPSELLNARLAPDMFPFHVQVRFACYQARDAMARLTAQEEPPPRPGPDDGEPTFAHLKTLIRETSESLAAIKPQSLLGAENRKMEVPLEGPLALEADGLHFLCRWTLPNFYFHVVTAYDILRHKGLAIGKRDFIRHVGPFLRTRAPA